MQSPPSDPASAAAMCREGGGSMLCCGIAAVVLWGAGRAGGTADVSADSDVWSSLDDPRDALSAWSRSCTRPQ